MCLQLPYLIDMALNQLAALQLLSLIWHTVTVMLETNKYVRCLLIDFSKAFDSVDHTIIVKKLVDLGLDQNVIDWVV